MKLELSKPRKGYDTRKLDAGEIKWKSCLPFVDTKRGKLIHRPREVSTRTHFKFPYLAIHHFCGTGICSSPKDTTFFSSVDDNGKLLCARCEAEAIKSGLPSAEELCGKHVHTGRLKPIMACKHTSDKAKDR